MFDSRDKDFQATLKKIISESQDTYKIDASRGSTSSTDIHISKPPKDNYQIVIKNRDDDELKCDKRSENKDKSFDKNNNKREIPELEVNN